MIIGVLLLVAWPVAYWLAAPSGWAYADAVENFKRGEFATAKSQFLQLLENDPHNAGILFRLAEIAYQEQEFEAAHQYAKQATSLASSNLKLQSIYLEANSLLALDQGEQAVQAINQIYAFSSLPADFSSLSMPELQSLMSKPANRRFLNSLAYVMAVANYRVKDAERYITAVISYFENEKKELDFAIPYLYERSSHYQDATDYLTSYMDQIIETLPDRRKIESKIAELKQRLEASEPESKLRETLRSELQTLEQAAGFPELYLATNRLMLLSQKVDVGTAQQYAQLMQKYESENINAQSVKLAVDDLMYLDYAAEMSPCYDTRAMCYYRIGESIVAKSMEDREDLPSFIMAMNRADEFFKKADDDMQRSAELKKARETFVEKYPDNSLMITLPSDEIMIERIRTRSDAVEIYHLMLIDLARARLEGARKREQAIRSLGFEPDRLLF